MDSKTIQNGIHSDNRTGVIQDLEDVSNSGPLAEDRSSSGPENRSISGTKDRSMSDLRVDFKTIQEQNRIHSDNRTGVYQDPRTGVY